MSDLIKLPRNFKLDKEKSIELIKFEFGELTEYQTNILWFCYKYYTYLTYYGRSRNDPHNKIIEHNYNIFNLIVKYQNYWHKTIQNYDFNLDNKTIDIINKFNELEYFDISDLNSNEINISNVEYYDSVGIIISNKYYKEGHIAEKIIFNIVEYLFCKFPVPKFLYHQWLIAHGNNRHNSHLFYIELFLTIANGKSISKEIKSIRETLFSEKIPFHNKNNINFIPNPYFPFFNKTQCNSYISLDVKLYNKDIENYKLKHYGIDYTIHNKFVILIWIINNNGSENLYKHISYICYINGFDFLYDVEESLNRYKIVEWFCKIEKTITEELLNNHCKEIIDYLLYKLKNDSNYSLKGRTYKSIIKQMEIWHKELKISQFKEYPQIWQPFIKNLNSFEKSNYSITEILNIQDLYDEGKELSHCVLSYIRHICLFKSSIWSLKQNNKRLLTIEINTQKQILQIRGYKNRLPTLQEMLILDEWFIKEGLVKTEGNMEGF